MSGVVEDKLEQRDDRQFHLPAGPDYPGMKPVPNPPPSPRGRIRLNWAPSPRAVVLLRSAFSQTCLHFCASRTTLAVVLSECWCHQTAARGLAEPRQNSNSSWRGWKSTSALMNSTSDWDRKHSPSEQTKDWDESKHRKLLQIAN